MAIIIKTNVPAVQAQQNMSSTINKMNKSIDRLSSGLKLRSSSDDPALMAMATNLRSKIEGIKRASANASEGVSALQIAEGGISQLTDTLIRMRELTMQAANETLASGDRYILQSELSQLKLEIDRISETTKYGSVNLLNGNLSVNGMNLQIGLNNSASDRLTIFIQNVGSEALGSGTFLSSISIASSASQAAGMLQFIDIAIDQVSIVRSNIGTSISRLEKVAQSQNIMFQNLTRGLSSISDVDVAEETSEMTKNNVLVQAGISVLSQANSLSQRALQLLQG